MAEDATEPPAAVMELLARVSDELRRDEAADERRRELNRLKVRRHYHRRQRLLSDLRQQVALLEAQLRRLHVRWQPPTRWRELLDGSERAREQLERENRALRHCLAARAALGPPAPRSPPALLVVRPLGALEVRRLRAQLRAQVAGFSPVRPALSRLGCVHGWEAVRGVDGGFFKLVLRRREAGARPEALLHATWTLLTHGRRFRALFSPGLGVKSDLVQPIDADMALALLRYRDHVGLGVHGAGAGAGTVKVLFALARLRAPHTIVLRAVERRRLVVDALSARDDPGDEWSPLFSWVRVDEAPGGAAITFGGAVPTLDARSPFWLLELLLVALRWERAVLGQRL